MRTFIMFPTTRATHTPLPMSPQRFPTELCKGATSAFFLALPPEKGVFRASLPTRPTLSRAATSIAKGSPGPTSLLWSTSSRGPPPAGKWPSKDWARLCHPPPFPRVCRARADVGAERSNTEGSGSHKFESRLGHRHFGVLFAGWGSATVELWPRGSF